VLKDETYLSAEKKAEKKGTWLQKKNEDGKWQECA